jgi:hypothetical protein
MNIALTQPPSVTFDSLTFSDGTTLTIDPTDIVVFVGPNNAGKSVALRELETYIGPATSLTVIKSVQLRRTGSAAELEAFLEKNSRKRYQNGVPHYQGYGYNLPANHLVSWWQSNLQQFRPIFCRRISTESRITNSNPPSAIVVPDDAPTHAIHMLYVDDRIEERLSRYFERSFGVELIVDRGAGNRVPLRVGSRPKPESGEDRVSATYLMRLRWTY